MARSVFLRGTLISTATGPRSVETLRSGDLIQTRENGLEPPLFLS
ncbi:MAG: Hint domain-containing protein [Paracoccaceae bacterium]